MFKVGDLIKNKETGRIGVIKSFYEQDNNYAYVRFYGNDVGTGHCGVELKNYTIIIKD